MKIIETAFEKLPRERLVIGFEGENQRATVRIDCASVFAEYPNATPSLIVKPLFADAYPVVVDRNGTDVDWLITSEILSFSGDGEIQLVFYKGEVICKSAVSKIRVSRSLQVTGEMPDPVVQWIENANRKLAEVDAQIVELEGMVDTATDAATRAEQSASTASTKAEQAAGSAATATEKATEATNAAGTATAKAAEAQTAARTATEKATAAAESERIATAKAGDATTAAGTATTKAEQATEAAQTATEKAGDASASATVAQASATDAASSATAASASETAAKASETAASTSASQAAQSVLDAGANAQTAMQKAAEATQSATNAAASATNAATSAETASTKAGEAAQSAQAVEETAEQLAESLEQIEQNTQDIAELDERKANIDGSYPDMTVGNAEQLNSSKFVENSEPYTFRTSGGSFDIGNREYLDAVVGGTVAWNQAVRDEASENQTDFAPIVTVTDAVEDAAKVRVKIEPVQDLHGYDHPWPAGGGKNKFPVAEWFTAYDVSQNNLIVGDVSVFLKAGAYSLSFEYYVDGASTVNSFWRTYSEEVTSVVASKQIEYGTLGLSSSVTSWTQKTVSFTTAQDGWFAIDNAQLRGGVHYRNIQLEEGSATDFAPYSNICPITGWDGVKVTRTGKNLFNPSTITRGAWVRAANPSDGSPIGSIISTSQEWGISDYIPVIPSTIYTIMLSNTAMAGSVGMAFYSQKSIDSAISGIPTIVIRQDPYAFTTPEGCHYVRFSFGVQYVNECMLQKGDATADYQYEAYQGTSLSVSWGTEAGTVYGGELTVNADGSGSLVVDRKNIVYDGSNNYTWTYLSNYHCMICGNEISDIEYGIAIVDYQNSYGIIVHRTSMNAKQLQFGSSQKPIEAIAPSVEEWKAKLNENPIQVIYLLATPITYTLTPTEIRTLLGENNVWSDAGQTTLTYTGTDEHLTLESGKKYLSRISGTDSMLLGSGQEITAAKGTDNVFDLTQMFGTAVADYVYGQGASFFRRWFGKQWYPYNAGELRHVEGLQSHDMVGFNQWDEEWEVGRINTINGVNTQATGIRSKNFIPVLPLTAYFLKSPLRFYVIEYDADKNFVRYAGNFMNEQYTTSANAFYVRFYHVDVTTYSNDSCINLSHNGSRNGEYEPYEKHSYPLDSSVILRGIPKVGANGVYWDGDRYLPDGTVKRKYGVVDLGTVNWLYRNSLFDGSLPNGKLTSIRDGGILAVCSKYTVFPLHWSALTDGQACVGCGYVNSSTCSIVVKDSAYTDSAAFKAAMQGVLLVYELATPTTETAQPYHSTQWVSDWGTEEFVSTGLVPVGHETRYPANLRDKLQHLPDAASGNGSYLITQTDGQMVLTPFPAPPSTAGNYVLKATVTGGVATYTWEVAT